MDTVRRARKSTRRPASGRSNAEPGQPQLRVLRAGRSPDHGQDGGQTGAQTGPQTGAQDADERLSAAVADLRWKLHDLESLRWRRNLIARGGAPLIAMPLGYEHIAQVLNSRRRLDERIADVICGVAKPLLGLIGAAGVAALIATSPLFDVRLVQGVELPGPARTAVPVLATAQEQQARWLGPPVLVVSAPVVASGAEWIGPAASSLASPGDPFAGSSHGTTLWSSRVLDTPGAGASASAPPAPTAAPGPSTPAAGNGGAEATASGRGQAPGTPASSTEVPTTPPSTPATGGPAPSASPGPAGTSTAPTTPAPDASAGSTGAPASSATPKTGSATTPSTTAGTAPDTPSSATPSSASTPAGTTGTAPTPTPAPRDTTPPAP